MITVSVSIFPAFQSFCTQAWIFFVFLSLITFSHACKTDKASSCLQTNSVSIMCSSQGAPTSKFWSKCVMKEKKESGLQFWKNGSALDFSGDDNSCYSAKQSHFKSGRLLPRIEVTHYFKPISLNTDMKYY